MSDRITVYLAGPRTILLDRGRSWRRIYHEIAIDYPRIDLIDPLRHEQSVEDIRNEDWHKWDLDNVASSDYLLVYWPGILSYGTVCEIHHAWMHCRTIIVVTQMDYIDTWRGDTWLAQYHPCMIQYEDHDSLIKVIPYAYRLIQKLQGEQCL